MRNCSGRHRAYEQIRNEQTRDEQIEEELILDEQMRNEQIREEQILDEQTRNEQIRDGRRRFIPAHKGE